MFKCDNCGETFDEPLEVEECVGEFWGSPAFELWRVCPYCKDNDFHEIEEDEEEC